MLCGPGLSADVEMAVWLDPLSEAEPRFVAPSKNVTLPVAVGDTVAVNVTESPKFDGLSELASVVVVPDTTVNTTLVDV